jgi:hypothetical protein
MGKMAQLGYALIEAMKVLGMMTDRSGCQWAGEREERHAI